MAQKTQLRLTQMSGSAFDDSKSAAALGSLNLPHLSASLDHMASAIKRIHGASSFTENVAGEFQQDITIIGTTPQLTIGDNGAEDAKLVFNSAGTDFQIGVDNDENAILRVSTSDFDGTAEVLELSDTLADFAGNIKVGADADGTDRMVTFGHSTLKSVIGIDDSGDVFAINTDAAFEAENDFQIDASGNVLLGNGTLQVGGNIIKASDGGSTITMDTDDNVTIAGDLTVSGNDLDFGNGATIVNTDANTLTITEQDVVFSGDIKVTGNDIVAGSDGNANIFAAVTTSTNAITLGGGGKVIAAGDLQVNGTSIDVDSASALTIGATVGANNLTLGAGTSTVVIPGDLTVQGDTVTVDVANLNVEDPFVFLANNSHTLDTNSGIVFASGSGEAARPDVVFGRVASNTWGLGTIAGTSGSLTDATGMVEADMGLRVGKVEFDTNADFIHLDTDLKVISAADIVLDPGGANVLPGSDGADDLGKDDVRWRKLFVDAVSITEAGRLDFDTDNDTSIRAQLDDTMVFEAGGADVMTLVNAGLQIEDDKGLVFGSNQDARFLYDEASSDKVLYTGATLQIADDTKLEFGNGGDAHIEYDENGTDQLRIGAPAAGIVIEGTTPTLVIGDAGAEDTKIVFDGNAQDFYIGLQDSVDDLVMGVGSTLGTTVALSMDEDRNVDIPAHNGTIGLKLGGTVVTANADELSLLDGGVAVGSSVTIADADGFILDDNGTSKKIPASDLKNYIASSNAPTKDVQVISTQLLADNDYNTNITDFEAKAENLVEVYVNGQLLARGANSGANMDFYPGGSSGRIKFEFDLEVDDVVTCILRAG